MESNCHTVSPCCWNSANAASRFFPEACESVDASAIPRQYKRGPDRSTSACGSKSIQPAMVCDRPCASSPGACAIKSRAAGSHRFA